MTIPGARTVENILAAIPTQAGLEKRIRELEAEVSVLTKENAKLKAQIKKLEPKPSADPKAIKALKIFYKHSTELNAFELAGIMKIEIGKSKHFISSLLSAGLIKSNRSIRDKFGPKYIITESGNELLAK